MPGIDHIELFILTADETHGCLRLRDRTDVVSLAGNVENRAGNVCEVYGPPTKLDFAFHQLILLVKLPNPLDEGRPGERHAVVNPLTHSQPGIHWFLLHDAVPHCDVGANVVIDWLEHTVAGVNQSGRDIAKGVGQRLRIEVLLAGPYPKQPHMLWSKIDGRGEQDQVSERLVREKRGI